jgi:hypothetical protein
MPKTIDERMFSKNLYHWMELIQELELFKSSLLFSCQSFLDETTCIKGIDSQHLTMSPLKLCSRKQAIDS